MSGSFLLSTFILEVESGGNFSQPFEPFGGIINNTYYDSTVLSPTVVSSDVYDSSYKGIFVKNIFTKNSLPIFDTLPYLSDKLPSLVVQDILDNPINVELCRDILIIQSLSYLTMIPLEFDGETFQASNRFHYYLASNNDEFDVYSNTVKVNDDIFFVSLAQESLSGNIFNMVPTLHKYDTIAGKKYTYSPIQEPPFFSSELDIQMMDCSSPNLVHDTRRNLFNLSFTLRDFTDIPHIYDISFESVPEMNVISKDIYSNNSTLSNVSTSTISFFLSSAPVSGPIIL
jgi:hypothetical protein